LITPTTIKKVNYFLSNIKRDVYKDFKSPKLRQILQFPVLFLGAKPSNTPSFYNFMNFADFGLGTWHPENGMYSIVEAMVALAESLGVTFHTDSAIEKINVDAIQEQPLESKLMEKQSKLTLYSRVQIIIIPKLF